MGRHRVNKDEPREAIVGDPNPMGLTSLRTSSRVKGFVSQLGGSRSQLLLVPVAMGLHLAHVPQPVQFGAALLGLMPLARLMGEATEHLAHKAGPAIGGILNAAFGNAAELIIALALLFKGKDTVVKASLTGSILGNILLVLGASLFAGGLRYPTQRFNKTRGATGSTIMVIAAMGLLVPAIFHALPEVRALGAARSEPLEHGLSLAVSIALIGTYALGLIFSLKSHNHIYKSKRQRGDRKAERDPTAWSARRSLAVLITATVMVGLMSDVLAGSIEETGRNWGLTEVFLGVVVVAIVGNAAEHSTAVIVALKNQMDLALEIAFGSAQQIALLVAPVLVFASYLRPHPMDLLFTTMEIVAVILSVIIARMVAEDGRSNWLEGAMLLMVYLLLAIAFFFLPVTPGPLVP